MCLDVLHELYRKVCDLQTEMFALRTIFASLYAFQERMPSGH